MKRILVIGCPGSGKSTLTRRLSEKLSLPAVHLDALFWEPGWKEASREDFDKRLADALSKPKWIIDGNFNRTIAARLAKCDTVIWLDYPRRTCICGVLRRVFSNYGKVRADMGAGCPERLDLSFLKYVWDFGKTDVPKIREKLKHIDARVLIFKNRRQTERFIKEEL